MKQFLRGKVDTDENLFEVLKTYQAPAAVYTVSLKAIDGIQQVVSETRSGQNTDGLPQQLSACYTRLLQCEADVIARGQLLAETPSAVVAAPQAVAEASEVALPVIEKPSTQSVEQTIRVESKRLDLLMDLAGELVINRSRFEKKLGEFRLLNEELQRAKGRLQSTLKTFQERFEYTRQNVTETAFAGAGSGGGEVHSFLGNDFSALEMDRYDEFNILSRTLMEIGDDTSYAIQQLERQQLELVEDASTLNRITNELQEEITSIRMAPVDFIMRRLERAVRDACEKEQKQVEFVTEGNDVRLDKVISEQAYHPLLHLVRNSVAHGFNETNQTETDTATSPQVEVKAKQEGAYVIIEVSDNGQGLDYARIREEAVKRSLISVQEEPTVEALSEMIFQSGFSTNAEVNEVSGRGIGLDVVRENILKLQGTITVNSEAGVGTTFIVRLPLTLAIDQAMFFTVENEVFALPISVIERVAYSRDYEIETIAEKDVVKVDGEPITLMHLNEVLGIPEQEAAADADSLIFCLYGARRIALRVNRILNKDDIAVKPLGPLLSDHHYFKNGTISGDGKVIPILDLNGIFAGENSETEASRWMPDSVIPETLSKQEAVRVLVVDDSLSVRKVCESYLMEGGFTVETANNGLEALELLGSRQYDVIFSDLEMPKLNGFELLGEMRRNPKLSDLPFVFITSRSAQKHRAKAEGMGVSDYLIKPFTREKLVSLAEKLSSKVAKK